MERGWVGEGVREPLTGWSVLFSEHGQFLGTGGQNVVCLHAADPDLPENTKIPPGMGHPVASGAVWRTGLFGQKNFFFDRVFFFTGQKKEWFIWPVSGHRGPEWVYLKTLFGTPGGDSPGARSAPNIGLQPGGSRNLFFSSFVFPGKNTFI